MPPSPERGQFLHLILEWAGSSELSDKLNSFAVQMYIAGTHFVLCMFGNKLND